MSKFIICFLFLLNLYNCEKKQETLIFEVNPNIDNEKEFNVNVGQEFIIKVYCNLNSWVFLNKNEKDTISFIKSDYQAEYDKDEELGLGRKGYLFYFFKANSKTEEPKLLKFTDTYSYLRQTNPIPKFIIKINVN